MTNPLVTTIIPTYNRALIIGRALSSVYKQTYSPIEVIVVDDGSTDDTAAIMSCYPGVIYIRQPNRGAAAARNTGLYASRGKYIAFLDSDDTWCDDKLRRQIKALEQSPDTVFCHTSYKYGDKVMHSGTLTGSAYLSIIRHCPVACSSVVVRRAMLHEGFPEGIHIAEDVIFWSRLARLGRIIGIDEPLTEIDVNPHSISQDTQSQITGLRNIIEYCVKRNPYLTTRERIELFAHLYYSVMYYKYGVKS